METTSATSILSTEGEDEEPQHSLDGSGDMSYENALQDGSGDHMGYGNGDQRPFTCIDVGGLDEEPNNDQGGTEYVEGGSAGDLDYGNYYGQDGNEDAKDGAREIGNQETTPEGEGDRSSNVTANDQSNTPEQKDEYLNDASDQPNIALNAELSQSEQSEDTSNNNNPSNFTKDGGIPPANASPPQPQPQPSALSNTNDGGSPPANTTANAPTSPQQPPQGVPTLSQPKPKPSSTANALTSPQRPQQSVHTQSYPKPKPNNTANARTSQQQPKQSVPTKSQPKAKPSSTANAPTSPQQPQQSATTQSQSKPSSDTPSKQETIMQPQQGQVQRELPNSEKGGGEEKAPSRSQSGGGGQDLPTPEEDSISFNRAFKGTAAHRTVFTNAEEEEEETGGDQGATHKYADGGDGDGDNRTNEEEETGGEEAEGGDGDGDNITNEEEEETGGDQIGGEESEGGDGDWDNIKNEKEEQETGGDQIGGEESEGGDGDGDNIINEEEEETRCDQIGGEEGEGGDGGWDKNRNEEADQNQDKTPKGKEDQDSNNTTNEQSDASKPNAELSQSEKSEETSNNNNPSNTKDGGSSPADNAPPQQQPPPSSPANTTANAPTPPQQLQQSVPTQSQSKPSSDTPSKQEKMQPQQGQVQIRELPNNEKVGRQEKAPSRSQSGGGQDLPTPEEDSISLNRAFKGKGCDVGKIVEILSNRDSPHIEDIKKHYLKAYGEELSLRLSSELSSLGKGDIKEKFGFDLALSTTLSLKFSNGLKIHTHIQRALSLWILDEAERDATIVRQGMSVASLDLEAVTEVICSRTPSQLRSLKQAYFSLYSSLLLDDITKSTFRFYGWHKELLIACLDDQKQKRDDGPDVDLKLAEVDAKQLYQDGENRWGTNEKTFVDIFTKSKRPYLAEVDAAYNKLYGHSLEKAVVVETSGYFRDGLLILLSCAKNSAKYFAEVLHKAMEGTGTSDTKLIRVVVTRANIDMEVIKNEYYLAYRESLKGAIHKNTSGHYRTFLLNLVDRSKGA